MNFLQIGRVSWERVAENIITCFCVGVARKISCTSRRMSVDGLEGCDNRASSRLTNLVEHLVTLIEDEALNVSETELLVSDEGVQTTGSGDDDVRVSLLVGEELNVFLHGSTTVEDGSLDVGHVLCESGVFVLDLVGELTGVAHDEDRGLTLDGLHLLESCEDEDGGLSQTGLGLADDIVTENGLRNALLLDWISQLCQNRFAK